MRSVTLLGSVVLVLLGAQLVACGSKQPPMIVPPASAPSPAREPPPAGQPAPRVEESPPVERQSPAQENIGGRSLDELNRDSPFNPVFFAYDDAELDVDAQKVVQAAAELLKNDASWIVAIEGYCDERGTAEYNLALGERRAMAVKTSLLSLGISPERLRIVSYGKEFAFDPAHSERAWAKNRRAQFVLISK